MKRANFLVKLARDGKLQAIEPNEDVKTAYLQKSGKSLSSAKALLEIGNLEDSVALAYYAMYHCLLALLFRVGIKCENHAAAIILLKSVFGLDNTEISRAKSDRVDKQYYVDFVISKEEVSDSIIVAEDFIASMTDFMARITEEKIKKYRQAATEMMQPTK